MLSAPLLDSKAYNYNANDFVVWKSFESHSSIQTESF